MIRKIRITGIAFTITMLSALNFNAYAQETVDSRLDDILAAADLIEAANEDVVFAITRLANHARSGNAGQIARWEAEITEARGIIETWQDEIQFYASRIEILNPYLDASAITSAAQLIEANEDYISIYTAQTRNHALNRDHPSAVATRDMVIGFTQDIDALLAQIRFQVNVLR